MEEESNILEETNFLDEEKCKQTFHKQKRVSCKKVINELIH
jgi:hypothetical protein